MTGHHATANMPGYSECLDYKDEMREREKKKPKESIRIKCVREILK